MFGQTMSFVLFISWLCSVRERKLIQYLRTIRKNNSYFIKESNCIFSQTQNQMKNRKPSRSLKINHIPPSISKEKINFRQHKSVSNRGLSQQTKNGNAYGIITIRMVIVKLSVPYCQLKFINSSYYNNFT